MSTLTQRKRYTPGSHRLNRIDLVVKTGSSGTEVEDDAGSSGADDTVIKPLSVCSIIAIIFFQKRFGVDDKACDFITFLQHQIGEPDRAGAICDGGLYRNVYDALILFFCNCLCKACKLRHLSILRPLNF